MSTYTTATYTTTAKAIGEIVAPMLAKMSKRLHKRLRKSWMNYDGAITVIGDYYTTKMTKEHAYCQRCESLSECQYKAIGNTGFRPDWEQWNPLYSYVVECRHKVAARTRARIERLFGNSGLPREYENLRLRDIGEVSQAYFNLLQLTNDKLRGVYIVGSASSSKRKLVSATGNELIIQGVETLYTRASSMLTQLRVGNPDYYNQLKVLTSIPALIIEELKPTNGYNEEQLEVVIESRIRQGLKLIVTSGYTPEAITTSESLREELKRLQLVECKL